MRGAGFLYGGGLEGRLGEGGVGLSWGFLEGEGIAEPCWGAWIGP